MNFFHYQYQALDQLIRHIKQGTSPLPHTLKYKANAEEIVIRLRASKKRLSLMDSANSSVLPDQLVLITRAADGPTEDQWRNWQWKLLESDERFEMQQWIGKHSDYWIMMKNFEFFYKTRRRTGLVFMPDKTARDGAERCLKGAQIVANRTKGFYEDFCRIAIKELRPSDVVEHQLTETSRQIAIQVVDRPVSHRSHFGWWHNSLRFAALREKWSNELKVEMSRDEKDVLIVQPLEND